MGEYVYCIVKREAVNVPVKGIEDGETYPIPYKDVLAIASEAPFKDYEPTEDAAKKHREVVLHVLKSHSVLPVAFGMVFKNRKILLANIRNVYHLLLRSLIGVDNKIELGVKVIFPKKTENFESEDIGEEFVQQDPIQVPDEIEVLEENVHEWDEKSIEDFRQQCGADFIQVLDKIAVRSAVGRLFSDRLVLNRSFLVNRNDIDKFSAEIDKLREKYPNLKIKFTGPWPPYNFVDIRILRRG